MSLINDALKRAQEAQRPNPASSVASIRTIETRQKERPFISRLLVVVIFLLLSAAFAFIGLAMTGRLAKKSVGVPQIAAAIPVAATAAPSQPVPAPTPAVVATPPTVSQPEPPPAPKPAPVVAPVVVAPPPLLVLPESLHVQAAAYNPTRPWAIVSGRTVYVGDLVKGVRVIGISANS